MHAAVDMAARERIASEVLGMAVRDGDMMPCRFQERHSHASGKRDMRVCLAERDGKLPTFFCFHSSCTEDWRPLNKELRRRIWFAEHGRDPDRGSAWDSGVASAPKADAPGRLHFDAAALERLQRPDWRVDEVFLRSRSPVDPQETSTERFLDELFLPGERVLIFTKFKSQGQFIYWVGRGFYRLADRPGVRAVPSKLPEGAPEGVWFLCQPVSGEWKVNPRVADPVTGRPKMSRRSEESVTAWRYMVLESDVAAPALWLNLLAQLPLPIAAIYTSAGKSIHALVRVDAGSKAAWDRIKAMVLPLFTKLGADGAALTAVRLTRLPGRRRGPRMQQLLYLNPKPEAAGAPIGEGGVLRG